MIEMAEQSTVNVTTCAVCLERFIEPKVLPCWHTFCKKCLEGILGQCESKEKLTCPQCRAEHQVPSSGLEGFLNDYTLDLAANEKQEPAVDICEMCDDHNTCTAVYFCTDCSANLCDSCTNVHKKIKHLKIHKIVPLDSDGVDFDKPKVLLCSQHPDRPLDAFCQTCKCVVCVLCIIDSHSGHHFAKIDTEVRKDVQRQIEHLVVEVKTKLIDYEKNHKYVSDVEDATISEQTPMRAEINRVFDLLVSEVEAQRSALLEKVELLFDNDLKQLWAQKEHVETTITHLRGTLTFSERSLQCSNDLEFLALGSQVMACLKKLKNVEYDSNGIDLINRTVRKVKFRETAAIDFTVGKLEMMTMGDLDVFFNMSPTPELGQWFEFEVGCRMSKSKRREKIHFSVVVFHGKKKRDIPSSPDVRLDPSGQSWHVAFVPVVSGKHVIRVKLGTHLDEDVTKEVVVTVTGEPAADQIVERGPDWVRWNEDGGHTNQGRVSTFKRGEENNVYVRWNGKDKDGSYRFGTYGCYDVQLVTVSQ